MLTDHPAPGARRVLDVVAFSAAALSFGAAGIHFSIIGAHFDEYWAFGVFFVALTWFQVAWGLGVLFRRDVRWLWILGGVVNLAVVALYVLTRTKGLPIGPEHWAPEEAQFSDVLCTCFEAAIGVLAIAALRPSWMQRPLPQTARLAAGGAAALLVAGTVSWALAVTPMEMGSDAAASTVKTDATRASTSSMAGMSGMSGSMPGMDMSGSNMSSMSSTDPSWHYTGPPLPASEAQLLSRVTADTDKGHAMQTASCKQAPTAAQQTAAMQLIQSTSAAVAKYHDINAAKADGYAPITSPNYPVVHYIKGAAMGHTALDPNNVQALVYADTSHGWVLAAAMYMTPGPGPMPGGCLTQWHAHTNLCMSSQTHVIQGFAPCAAGSFLIPTPEMLHVWQIPVPGGPLAMDPSDLQVVEAATMAS